LHTTAREAHFATDRDQLKDENYENQVVTNLRKKLGSYLSGPFANPNQL